MPVCRTGPDLEHDRFGQAKLPGKAREGFCANADGREDAFPDEREALHPPLSDGKANLLDRDINRHAADKIIAGELLGVILPVNISLGADYPPENPRAGCSKPG